ncbi:MAG: helix-turn-helix domain-containing protein [Burkholderiales bacterium]|nr:helix-turn-helix domain-containing protein [Burkholderiales bacterium]
MSKSLTPKQNQAVSLIAAGKSQRQVAEEIGVSPQTITAWVHLPAFQDQLEAMLTTARKAATTQLLELRIQAIERLELLLNYGPFPVQLNAARIILGVTAASPKSF